jgi:hypothetical protein
MRKPSGEPSFRVYSRGMADTPNRFTVEFQDSLNEYQQDSFSLVDPEDVALGLGGEGIERDTGPEPLQYLESTASHLRKRKAFLQPMIILKSSTRSILKARNALSPLA